MNYANGAHRTSLMSFPSCLLSQFSDLPAENASAEFLCVVFV